MPLLSFLDTPTAAGSYEIRLVWPDGTHAIYHAERAVWLADLAERLTAIAGEIREKLEPIKGTG